MKVLIIGAGITGCTLARLFANNGDEVTLIDKNNFIGGQCYDEVHESGIFIQKFGSHIFHTKHKFVWDFVNDFASFNNYVHVVKTYVDGQLFNFPLTFDDVKRFFISDDRVTNFYKNLVQFNLKDSSNFESFMSTYLGPEIYYEFVHGYTKKQWGREPKELDTGFVWRIKFEKNNDNRYFKEPYQGIPIGGYTNMFKRMIDDKNIEVILQRKFLYFTQFKYESDLIIATSSIDEFYDHVLGELEYVGGEQVFEFYNQEHYQENTVVNFPNECSFIRIHEFKDYYKQKFPFTVVSKEYPCRPGFYYYPVYTNKNKELYQKYVDYHKAGNEKIIFAGRLGSYKYLNMDEAIKRAIELFKEIKK